MKESDVAGGAAQEVGAAPGGIGNRRGRSSSGGADGSNAVNLEGLLREAGCAGAEAAARRRGADAGSARKRAARAGGTRNRAGAGNREPLRICKVEKTAGTWGARGGRKTERRR